MNDVFAILHVVGGFSSHIVAPFDSSIIVSEESSRQSSILDGISSSSKLLNEIAAGDGEFFCLVGSAYFKLAGASGSLVLKNSGPNDRPT